MVNAMNINTLAQIKMMAHPLRMKLLEAFSCKPVTTKQIAQRLGEQPTKLYHHVDALRRVGLLKLVKTQKKRGTLEKYYQTAAQVFTIDRRLFQLAPQSNEAFSSMQTVFTGILENTLIEVKKSLEERFAGSPSADKRVILSHAHIRATPDQIQKLEKKVNKLLKEYESVRPEKGVVEYGFTLVFYPEKNKGKKKKQRRFKKRSKK